MKRFTRRRKPVYAFIDAANLFYGGEKSLGWRIDYRKLFTYLKRKYRVRRAFYYAGIELFGFPYTPLDNKPLNLAEFRAYLETEAPKRENPDEKTNMENQIKRVEFYQKLEGFGYTLCLKQTKVYRNDEDDTEVKKANCDVDMTLDLVRYMAQYSAAVILTGDGDFYPVLHYLIEKKRNVTILARGERSAKEIRQLAGKNFRDFNYLREQIKFEA